MIQGNADHDVLTRLIQGEASGEKLSEIIQTTFGVKNMHPVVFTAGSEEKTSFMRKHAIKIYYGDADGDMRQAKEVGARPIRVLRASNSTYKPMPKNGGVRVDTGVYEGGEIPMYYDSMIAKLIVHGKDRGDAIARMREALNGFVIRGVQSNIPFQAALLAHPRFQAGDFNTGFIAEHYAHGFSAADVPHADPSFLVALAACLHKFYRNRARSLQGQFWEGKQRSPRRDFTVCTLGHAGDNHYVNVTLEEGAIGPATRVTVHAPGGDRVYDLHLKHDLGDARIEGQCNGHAFTAQMERGRARNPLAIRVIHNGTQLDALVMQPRTAELHRLMPYKAPPDMSKYVLSPMPGLLVQVAVKPGQEVKAGERVAVIEAMKMENVLFASADGVVKAVKAEQGDSLAVDQAIVEFE